MSSNILDFQKFKLLLEGAGGAARIEKKIDLNFNFDPGRYKVESIDPAALASLKKTFVSDTVAVLANSALNERSISIDLEASTSTTPITPALASELGTKAGTAGNVKLCEARMNTMEQIITDSLATALGMSPEKIKSSIKFNKVNKANQGGGTTPEELKKFQYIKATIIQVGTPVEPGRVLRCNFKGDFKGVQATPANNYVGYGQSPDQQLVTNIAHGQEFYLSLDSLQIPDCVYIRYGDTEFLSPFTGLKKEDRGRDFEAELNKLNADQTSGLVALMNAELAKIGATGTVETLQPAFFTKDSAGNSIIKVLPGATQGGSNQYYTKKLKRDAFKSNVIIRVFAPLGNTEFGIRVACG